MKNVWSRSKTVIVTVGVVAGLLLAVSVVQLGIEAFEHRTGLFSFLEKAFGIAVVVLLGACGGVLAISPFLSKEEEKREWGMALLGVVVFGFMSYVLWKSLR